LDWCFHLPIPLININFLNWDEKIVALKFVRTSYVVWEITLNCNLACSHCGSRAGDSRSDELSTAEALDLVEQMRDVGIKEVTLIGGEAFMRPDWLEIAAAIDRAGMWCSITTGGFGVSLDMAKKMKAAGIKGASVSIDGLEATHDGLRGRTGSWKSALQTMKHLQEVGIVLGCNSQINRLSAPELPRVYELIREVGIVAWQIQLTVPMGNAADREDILMQPYELLDLYPMLARIARQSIRDGIQIRPGNNIGYYGPYERLIRGQDTDWGFWEGCSAGLTILGIEADGKIKGCPSLPTTAYTGGNIRDRSLQDIVENTAELNFNIHKSNAERLEHLWGFCKTCEFAELCRGGCSWTAHVFFDRRGNNPFCHHRALAHAEKGIGERFYQEVAASGSPFDNGIFAIVEEPLTALQARKDKLSFTPDRIQWSDNWQEDELYDGLQYTPNPTTTTNTATPVGMA
jgi:nif11-class peptide radical SAM maturase 3